MVSGRFAVEKGERRHWRRQSWRLRVSQDLQERLFTFFPVVWPVRPVRAILAG